MRRAQFSRSMPRGQLLHTLDRRHQPEGVAAECATSKREQTRELASAGSAGARGSSRISGNVRGRTVFAALPDDKHARANVQIGDRQRESFTVKRTFVRRQDGSGMVDASQSFRGECGWT